MNGLHPRIRPSAGAGLGKTLVEARIAGDTGTVEAVHANFTVEQILSSLWETLVWVTAHTRVHGDINAIDAVHAAAVKDLPGLDTAEGQWASEFLETFDEALQHDAESKDAPRRSSRRPMLGRPIFTTWLAIQEPGSALSTGVRPYVGFNGPRAAFSVTVLETSDGMLEGAVAAAAAVISVLAEQERVPVPLLLTVVNAVTLGRGIRGDYAV